MSRVEGVVVDEDEAADLAADLVAPLDLGDAVVEDCGKTFLAALNSTDATVTYSAVAS
jgi:hypothetical protein